MKTIPFLITMVALILISCQPLPPAEKATLDDLNTNPELIKSSTLLIVVESIQPAGVTLEYTMGTLVKYQGESYIVTHNHYSDSLQDMDVLELRDAENRLIRPIYFYEFQSLILYQDAGTMVLRAPDGVADALTPGSLDAAPQLNPGDTVQVAYRAQPNRDKVQVLDAVVEEICVSRIEPAYQLRSLNGQPLRPGDSGGGVWYNGRLVANTWSVLTTQLVVDTSGTIDPSSETLTDLSCAAIFPEVFR